MSNSKFRYYQVNTTTTVRANSQRDAISLMEGDDVPGDILTQDYTIERINAADAHVRTASI